MIYVVNVSVLSEIFVCWDKIDKVNSENMIMEWMIEGERLVKKVNFYNVVIIIIVWKSFILKVFFGSYFRKNRSIIYRNLIWSLESVSIWLVFDIE